MIGLQPPCTRAQVLLQSLLKLTTNPYQPSPIWLQVFKAHITTSPSGQVSDMFWFFDNRNELPENHRCGEGQPGLPRAFL